MANALFGKGKEKLLSGSINLPGDTIKAAIVNNGYTPNLSTHEWYSDISSFVLGTPQTLGSKSVTLGVFDAADPTFSGIAPSNTAKALVIYKDTGVPGTSALLAYIDTITGFPLATNGGDIQIIFDAGANKIFAI